MSEVEDAADEALITRLVEEALVEVDGLVTQKEREVMRRLLQERMRSPAGMRRLAAMKAAPTVEQSGTVARDAAEVTPERKRRPA